MANSIINADTEGLKHTGGDVSTLVIQTNGNAAVTISNTQAVVLANALPVASGGTGSNTAAGGLSNLGGVSTGKAIVMSIVFGG